MHLNNQQTAADEELVMESNNTRTSHYYAHKQIRENQKHLLFL